MVAGGSSERLKTIILSLEFMTQVSLPVSRVAQVNVMFSPAHAAPPAKGDVMAVGE